MNPKEIIKQLALLSVKINERTLYNYSAWKLIPEPQRGSGRSGKWVDYPNETLGEAYAAWRLMHGSYWHNYTFEIVGITPPKLSPTTVAAVRSIKMKIDQQDWTQTRFKRKPNDLEEGVKFFLFLQQVDDEDANIIISGYIKLWTKLSQEAHWRATEILNDPEY